MEIYKLANDLEVDRKDLLLFVQKQGIEAKSIASSLTPDEEEKVLKAFDEAGGILDSVSEVEKPEPISAKDDIQVSLPEKKVQKKKERKKIFPKVSKFVEKNIENYEKVPKKKEPAKVKEVDYQKAKTIYKVVSIFVVLLLIACGVSAIRANTQMMNLQKSANTSIKVLNENQKSLSQTVEKLQKEVKGFEAKQEESKKNEEKKKTPPKQKQVTPHKEKSKK